MDENEKRRRLLERQLAMRGVAVPTQDNKDKSKDGDEEEAKLISDETAARLKSAGTQAKKLGQWGAAKTKEAATAAADKARAARNEIEARQAERKRLADQRMVATAQEEIKRAGEEQDRLEVFRQRDLGDGSLDETKSPEAMTLQSVEVGEAEQVQDNSKPTPPVPVRRSVLKDQHDRGETHRRGSNAKFIAVAAAIVVAGAGCAGWWWTQRDVPEKVEAPAEEASTNDTAPIVEAPPAEPSGFVVPSTGRDEAPVEEVNEPAPEVVPPVIEPVPIEVPMPAAPVEAAKSVETEEAPAKVQPKPAPRRQAAAVPVAQKPVVAKPKPVAKPAPKKNDWEDAASKAMDQVDF